MIVQALLRDLPSKGINVASVAGLTGGFSAADLSVMVERAKTIALRDSANERARTVRLMQEHLEAAIDVRRAETRRIAEPPLSWDDVIVDVKVKERLQLISRLWEDPRRYLDAGIPVPKGIIFYGPPGTGKTLLAKVLADQTTASFISVRPDDVMSRWVGDSEKLLANLFREARDVSPTILFIDEVEALLPKREYGYTSQSEATKQVVAVFLQEMDDIDIGRGRPVFVVGATNFLDAVDAAVRREGRLGEHIAIRLPNSEGRVRILECHLRGKLRQEDVELRAIAAASDGFSGAALAEVVHRALQMRLTRSDEDLRISQADLLAALESIQIEAVP
jgi:transitional endoplasmic reticulum ATPase